MSAPDRLPVLTAIEARILGSLVEKAATTPDLYPLTIHSIVIACNQKTARDPVMDIAQRDIEYALRQLEVRGWVKSQHTQRSQRVFHRMEAMLDITRQQACLLALLMLRGPQSAHELLGRSERMAVFADVEAVLHALERLASREVPLVAQTERRSGQRSDRYHTLLMASTPEDEEEVIDEAPGEAPRASLRERIEALEARVAALEARLQQDAAAD